MINMIKRHMYNFSLKMYVFDLFCMKFNLQILNVNVKSPCQQLYLFLFQFYQLYHLKKSLFQKYHFLFQLYHFDFF